MGAWEQYLDAAQRLDAARREAETLAAERAAVAKAAAADLATTRRRLEVQRARLIEAATRLGVRAPRVTVDAAELAHARTAMGYFRAPNPTAAAAAALRANRATLDAGDAAVSTLEDPHGPAQTAGIGRNSTVYALAALTACLIPMLLVWFGPGDPARRATVLVRAGSYCGAVVLPLLGYALAWILTGALGRHPGVLRPNRSAALGAVITVGCVILVYGTAIVLSR
jgi:hypothetical protein